MASDEAPRQGAGVRWNIFHNGWHAYDCETRTQYREKGDDPADDDTFEMQTFIRVRQQPGQKAPLRRLRGFTRFTREGILRTIHAQLHMVVQPWELVIDLDGPVSEGQLLPRWRITVADYDDGSEDRVFDRPWKVPPATVRRQFETPFKPMNFTDHGIVLNPLQPPNRLDTLRPGMEWRMPMVTSLLVLEALTHSLDALVAGRSVDDLRTTLASTFGAALADVPFLEARVLPQTELLPPMLEQTGPRRDPPSCWVIDAGGEDGHISGRLWIQQSDGERKGLALRQEVVIKGEQGQEVWMMQRE
jgi:hypothetical protein